MHAISLVDRALVRMALLHYFKAFFGFLNTLGPVPTLGPVAPVPSELLEKLKRTDKVDDILRFVLLSFLVDFSESNRHGGNSFHYKNQEKYF